MHRDAMHPGVFYSDNQFVRHPIAEIMSAGDANLLELQGKG
jgi:hypothetical protein